MKNFKEDHPMYIPSKISPLGVVGSEKKMFNEKLEADVAADAVAYACERP
jgi:hypothetical protein